MKILFINSFYSPDIVGGAEVVLQSLVEGIAAQGIEAAVLATTSKPGLQRDEVNGITVWRAGLRNLYWHKPGGQNANLLRRRFWHLLDIYNPLMKGYVAEVICRERPSVASVHNLSGWSVSAWSALNEHNVPTVQILHDYHLICPRNMVKNGRNCKGQCASCKIMRFPHKMLSRHLAGVVGVSRYILGRYLDAEYFQGIPVKRVIHNACNSQELGLEANVKKQQSRNPLRFGFIGTLAPHKGIELLLRIYTQSRFPETELWIAGTGNAEYTAKLKHLAAGNPIKILGRVTPNEFYRQVDIVIVPSLWNEPLGMVIMEALVFGKPIIASSVGGIPEMIKNGINGLLFNPDRPEGLLIAMQRLSKDCELRANLAKAASESGVRFMDRQHFMDEHIAVYQAAKNAPHLSTK